MECLFFLYFQEGNRLKSHDQNRGSETARFGKIELDLVPAKLENVSSKSNFINYFLTHTCLYIDNKQDNKISTPHTNLILVFNRTENSYYLQIPILNISINILVFLKKMSLEKRVGLNTHFLFCVFYFLYK